MDIIKIKIKLARYSQTQLFFIIKGDNVSALLLSHHQACTVSNRKNWRSAGNGIP
jgi:hypothetical protein